MHVGAATKNNEIDANDFEIFFVPKGTMVVLRKGVWHHAVFAAGDGVINALIALPERTYKNDCTVVRFTEDKCIFFEEM
jgi:ureidoglycolate lyase